MISPQAQLQKARTIYEKRIVEVYSNYQNALKNNDALDFDYIIDELHCFNRVLERNNLVEETND